MISRRRPFATPGATLILAFLIAGFVWLEDPKFDHAHSFPSIGAIVVLTFLAAGFFWVTDQSDIRRLVRASQFRLRTLFLGTTLAGVICAILKANGELQSWRDVEKLAGAVVVICGFGLMARLGWATVSNMREIWASPKRAESNVRVVVPPPDSESTDEPTLPPLP